MRSRKLFVKGWAKTFPLFEKSGAKTLIKIIYLVCAKSVLKGRGSSKTLVSTLRCQHCGVNAAASRRPIRVCGDNLLKLKISTAPFRSRAELAKRSNLRAAGGIR